GPGSTRSPPARKGSSGVYRGQTTSSLALALEERLLPLLEQRAESCLESASGVALDDHLTCAQTLSTEQLGVLPERADLLADLTRLGVHGAVVEVRAHVPREEDHQAARHCLHCRHSEGLRQCVRVEV